MHTLGFIFEPGKHEKSIADGPAILDYINRIVDERHIRERIRLDSKVGGADWDSAAARWPVPMEDSRGARSATTVRWNYLGSGCDNCDETFEDGCAGRGGDGRVLGRERVWEEG